MFYVLYANIDNFNPTEHTLDVDSLSVMDKWILSKLNGVIKEVDDNLFNYKIVEATRAISEFTDELSNWYVRRSRERFWASELSQDKINAYMTLYTVLVEFSKVCAPFIPFMTEQIYQNLVLSVDKDAKESVHICDYPAVREEFSFPEIEKDMDAVRKIVIMGRACRNEANIKNRQPLQKLYVQTETEINPSYIYIILDELNIKEVEFVEDASGFIAYKFKPQMRTMGPKYGKLMRPIFDEVAKLDGKEVMAVLNSGEPLKLTVQDVDVEITKDDVLIETEQMNGLVSNDDGGFTVILDTNLTDELKDEGFLREIISKIQTMRKDADFEVQDRINIKFSANDKIKSIFTKFDGEIKQQTLADTVENTADTEGKEWNINGEKVVIAVAKA